MTLVGLGPGQKTEKIMEFYVGTIELFSSG